MKYSLVFLCLFCSSQIALSQLHINEIMASNSSAIADNFGESDDWIEIYNASASVIDLNGYFISDDPTNIEKFQFTSSIIIPANGFVIIWADEEQLQGPDHANFKLNSNGEQVILTDPNGVTNIDNVTFPAMASDQSYARKSDGSPVWEVFQISSPLAPNSTGETLVSAPLFSLPSGIYTGNQTLQISADPNTTIYYTVDGTDPNTSSQIYSGPITINSTASVKALAVDNQNNQSTITVGSFVLNPTTELAIVHVIIDPFYLYDDSLGMYVIGTNGVSGPCHDDLRNWSQDWEYRADVLLYEKDGSIAFKEGCGLEISGACSRNSPQKSFNVSFKSKYGSKKIDYKLFDSKEETSFDGFKLRAGRASYRMYDVFNQELVSEKLDVDQQAYRPVALYLNNTYWGLYYIRDRMNKGFVETYYDSKVDADNIDLIKLPYADRNLAHWIYEDVKEGDKIDYYALDTFMMQNSLNNPANYDYVKTKIDINSFLDYFITESYYNSGDWPGNNLKTWRPRAVDGKWRWMLFDVESSHWDGGAQNTSRLSEIVFETGANQYSPMPTRPFRQLLQSDEFQSEYIQRTNTYIHTIWDTIQVLSVFNSIKNEIRSEIQDDYVRWNAEMSSWDVSQWDQSTSLYDFFVARPDYMRVNIDNAFGTAGRIDLSFITTASTNGRIHLHSNYFEIPHNYTGTYHQNVPINIHAIPDQGYRFSHWQETGITNPNLYQAFTTNTTLTPVFVVAQDLVINEIHYNPAGSSEAPEFIEIYNPDSASKPLDAYQFGDGICFEFPSGSIIGPGEYIIIANDASLYTGNGYQVFQWENSKLDNDGEALRLVNRNNQVVDSLTYNDAGGWISTADNGFYSLALVDHTLDNSQASSWDVQFYYTTPGAANEFLPYNTYHIPSDLVINELHYHPLDSINPNGDTISSKNFEFVEIKNISNISTVSLTGVALSRGVTYQFPTGTSIPPQGFVVIAEDSLKFIEKYGFSPFGQYSGKLSDNGELVWLSRSSGILMDAVQYDNVFPWDTEANGGLFDYSLALVDETKRNDIYINWKRQCTALQTPGEENDFACFNGLNYDGLTINEIHYNPIQGTNYEYLEIVNHSSTLMNLREVRVTGGVSYTFNEDVIIPGRVAAPANYIILAKDSTSFHNQYGFAPHGVYNGIISNLGETLILEDFFEYEIDKVTYDDVNPWPALADQGLHSLALISGNLDNSLASSWCTQDINLTPKAVNSFADSDADAIIDCLDQCAGVDDNLIGAACDDGDPCTIGESYNNACDCTGGTFQDSDADGVCDASDICSGFDDNIDLDNNGIPDGCEQCADYISNVTLDPIVRDTSAQISITTNGLLTTGMSIEYHAGQYVEMTAGFEVELGSTFHTYISPCN